LLLNAESPPERAPLFSENLDNVFRVDANRVGLAKEKNDVKISRLLYTLSRASSLRKPNAAIAGARLSRGLITPVRLRSTVVDVSLCAVTDAISEKDKQYREI